MRIWEFKVQPVETQCWRHRSELTDTLDFFLDTDQTEELQLYLIHTWFRHSRSASCINITNEGAEVFFFPIPAALFSLCCPSVSDKSPVSKWNLFFTIALSKLWQYLGRCFNLWLLLITECEADSRRTRCFHTLSCISSWTLRFFGHSSKWPRLACVVDQPEFAASRLKQAWNPCDRPFLEYHSVCRQEIETPFEQASPVMSLNRYTHTTMHKPSPCSVYFSDLSPVSVFPASCPPDSLVEW